MTIQIRRALFALALGFSLPLASPLFIAPAHAQVAPETMTLRATVFDESGKPAEGATVVLVFNDEDGKNPTVALQTDAQGQFETTRPKTKWGTEAFVHAPGLALQRAYLKTDGDNSIVLKQSVAASGKVVDGAGKPVANARVKMTRLFLSAETEMMFRFMTFEALEKSALQSALETQTDAEGNWKIADLPVGAVGYFQLEDARFARNDGFGVPGETSQIVPDLKATPGAKLKGRVTSPDGKPVAGARVNVNVGEKQSSYASTITAPDGTYQLESLLVGDATIQVDSLNPAWAPTSIQGVTVAANQTATAPEIRLDAGVLLTGKVTDKDSKAPVAGARVMATGDFGNAPSATTGKDGLYQVRVPTGKMRFYLYSRPEDYVREMFADSNANVTANSANAPDFAIQRGLTLSGTARDETGAPAADASIQAGSMWEGAQTSVDAQGNWTLKGVNAKSPDRGAAKGKTRLTTSGDWQIVGDGLVAAREDEKIALVLRRVERRDVTLRVVTPTGEPVEGASVRIAILFDAQNGSTRYETALSNARGEVTAHKLRPDESAEVTPTKEGYALQKAGVIAVEAENKARATDAVLTPKNGIVRGRVLDVAGVPVAGASVAAIWPGDLRGSEKSFAQSDANGKFELDNLRAGELIIGAARGRNFGQVAAQTGGEIEIQLAAASAQPAPENRVLAREVLQQWFDESKHEEGATSESYAMQIAGMGSPETDNYAARGGDGKLWFESEQTPERAKIGAERALQKARAAVEEPKKAEEHQRAQLDLATLLVQQGDLKGAREVYLALAPDVKVAREIDPNQAMWDAYKYAQLAGIAGAIEHPGADYWVELLDRSLDQMSADDRLFRIGGYAETLAKTDANGTENWLDARAPAEQVRSYEDVIPVVAARDLPRAQAMLVKMEALVARGDIPVEPDRNDAMYRPTPPSSLNTARAAIVRKLLPTDPRAAYEQAQKIVANEGYGFGDLTIETAMRLPAAQTLPILRAQFVEAQNKDNRSVAAMARLAKLVAPLDAQLSEQWFDLARQKLAEDNGYGDDTREMAAPYAFYNADMNPAQSRLLLENEWQRATKIKSDNQYLSAARLRNLVWAMAPLDWERALQMLREADELQGDQHADGLMVRHNLTAWLLSSEQERREMDFDGARAALLD